MIFSKLLNNAVWFEKSLIQSKNGSESITCKVKFLNWNSCVYSSSIRLSFPIFCLDEVSSFTFALSLFRLKILFENENKSKKSTNIWSGIQGAYLPIDFFFFVCNTAVDTTYLKCCRNKFVGGWSIGLSRPIVISFAGGYWLRIRISINSFWVCCKPRANPKRIYPFNSNVFAISHFFDIEFAFND